MTDLEWSKAGRCNASGESARSTNCGGGSAATPLIKGCPNRENLDGQLQIGKHTDGEMR